MRYKELAKAKTKVAAAVFAAAMTISPMAQLVSMTPVYALTKYEDTTYDAAPPTASEQVIQVSNIDESATVTAYQLVEGKYKDGQLVKYQLTELGDGITAGYYGTESGVFSDDGLDTVVVEDLVAFNENSYTETGKSVTIDDVSYPICTNGSSFAIKYNDKWHRVAAIKSNATTTSGQQTTTTHYYASTDPSTELTTFLETYVSKAADKVRSAKAGTYTGISMEREVYYKPLEDQKAEQEDQDNANNSSLNYFATAYPGLYLVLVTNTESGTVYNPMLVSVNVDNPEDLSDGVRGETVSVTSNFQNGSSVGYAKSSSTGITKSIVTNDGDVKGSTAAPGDTINFKLSDITIPSYSEDYGDGLIFTITDTLESSTYGSISNLLISVGGEDLITWKDNTYTYPSDAFETLDFSSNVLTIKFKDQYIREHGGEKVVVTYSSPLSKTNAGTNYSENSSQAVVTWSDDPTDVSSTSEKKSSVYNYTFGIDAPLDDESGTNTETYEISKTFGESGDFSDSTHRVTSIVAGGLSRIDEYNTRKSAKALKGATFALYSDETCETPVKITVLKSKKTETSYNTYTETIDATAESDDNGHLSFEGINAGTYYLKETAAPNGYSVSDTVYKLVIEASINETTGAMESYSVTTYSSKDNYKKALGTSTYTSEAVIADDGTITNNITQTVNEPVEIINTRTSSGTQLPFTGGEGDYMFYVTTVSALGMAGVVFVIRKKLKENA